MSALAATPATFSVFRNRSFRLMWTGQLVSSAGSALTAMASGILVYRLTGAASSVGLMMMAAALPTLFVGLIAGVFVDRYDRRRIMIWSDLARAALVVMIPFALQFSIVWLYVIVALSSAVQQFFDPAYASVLPEVASDEELAAANSLMTISSLGAQAIGFAGSGLIATLFPIEWSYYIDAVTFGLSATCIALVRVNATPAPGKTTVTAVIRNLDAGLKTITGTRALRSLFLVYLPVFITFGLNNALMLPFARRALSASEFEYSLLEGVSMAGIVAGSLALARLGDRLRPGQWVAISFLGMAVCGIVFSQLRSVPGAIFVGVISAAFNAPSVVGRQLIIQRNGPRETRGRVFSAFYVMRDSMFMLGMVGAGLGDLIDVRILFLAQSVAFLAVGSLALILPGLGQPAAEWRRAIALLRGAPAAPGLGIGRAASAADFDRLAVLCSAMGVLSAREREELASESLVASASTGTTILRKGEASDAAYFLLEGAAVAGWAEDGRIKELGTLNAGDFFGEIAALSGGLRTANVVATQACTVLQIPARLLRTMMKHPELSRMFLSVMTERLLNMHMLDLPRRTKMDQDALRDLRIAEPDFAAN